MSAVNRKKLFVMALYAGEIMMRNGAEAYRVEDTIIRLCKSRGFSFVEAYVTPTGIFMSIDSEGEDHNEMLSYIKRLTIKGINLNKIAEVNNFSRQFVSSDLSVEAAMQELRRIDQLPPYPIPVQAFSAGIASAFVALLFGANGYEFAAALVTSMIITTLISYLQHYGLNHYVSNMAGGFISALFAIGFSYLHPAIQVDLVIVGAIMTMVPGVAITNALRDSLAGDLVSGLARGMEALLIAISIAVGVGFPLQAWVYLTGGTLL